MGALGAVGDLGAVGILPVANPAGRRYADSGPAGVGLRKERIVTDDYGGNGVCTTAVGSRGPAAP